MEEKQQAGTVDFSSWKVLPLSTSTPVMLSCSSLVGYYMGLLRCAELLINHHLNSKYPGEGDFEQITQQEHSGFYFFTRPQLF